MHRIKSWARQEERGKLAGSLAEVRARCAELEEALEGDLLRRRAELQARLDAASDPAHRLASPASP